MPATGFDRAFAQDATAEMKAILAATQCPINVKCIQEKAPRPLWKDRPSLFLVAENDRMIAAKTQHFESRRMGATVRAQSVDHCGIPQQEGGGGTFPPPAGPSFGDGGSQSESSSSSPSSQLLGPLSRWFMAFACPCPTTPPTRVRNPAVPNNPTATHVFRHTTAVHLLESGVEPNVIWGWLGHASLETTNRYAEINLRMKQKAMEACQPPVSSLSSALPRKPIWQADAELLKWLKSLWKLCSHIRAPLRTIMQPSAFRPHNAVGHIIC